MTNNERELIKILRENDNPEKALKIAMDLMIDFLTSYEALQDTSFVPPQEAS